MTNVLTADDDRKLDIQPSEIVILRSNLDRFSANYHDLRGCLSNDELARADRFLKEQHRVRFVVARGLLRQTLGRIVRHDPAALVFAYNAFGKPVLDQKILGTGFSFDSMPLHFNVTHSRNELAIAFARSSEIGIDLESQSRIEKLDSFARICLSEKEMAEYLRLAKGPCPNAQTKPLGVLQREFLIQHWVLKEAFLKATGTGINRPLNEIRVLATMNNWWMVQDATGSEKPFRLRYFALPGPLSLAVAIMNPVPQFRIRFVDMDYGN